LFDRITTAQHRATKRNPIGKLVVVFDLRGFCPDVLAHRGIGYKFEQKEGPFDTAELAKCPVKAFE
jgi:hypothetical protein